jgi:hypothetical protein
MRMFLLDLTRPKSFALSSHLDPALIHVPLGIAKDLNP